MSSIVFSFFQKPTDADFLRTGRAKIEQTVQLNLRSLAMQRKAGLSMDSKGNVDSRLWATAVQNFVDTFITPQLTVQERYAIGKVGLSEVCDEMIETVVRLECRRLHDTGEVDMTVPIVDGERFNRIATKRSASAPGGISRGLIIRADPLERILSGQKTWEMRSAHTKIRGRIALIRKGSKAVFGTASIVDSRGPLTKEEMLKNVHLHGITASRLDDEDVAGYCFAWVLVDVKRLDNPIPYQHAGGVTFVTLDAAAIELLGQR